MRRHLCSVCDAVSGRDPTGTEKIRSLTRQDAAVRVGRVLAQLQTAIVKHDLLALGPQSPSHYTDSHLRLVALSKWLAAMLGVNFHNFLAPAIGKAWEMGTIRARGEVKIDATPKDASAIYLAWVRSELDGVLAAGVQLVSRDAVAIRGGSPVKAYRRLQAELMKIRPRLEALVNTSIVKAYNAAKLATYTEVGVRRVGVVPERLRSVQVGDADPLAPYRAMARRRRGVGTMVSVQTAEDDLVCVDCEDAADAGPYTVTEAYDLFPMHVNCRCSFVPYDEDDEEFGDTGWTEEAREAALEARRANSVAHEGATRSDKTQIAIEGPKVEDVKRGLSLLPQEHIDKFPGSIVVTTGSIGGRSDAVGVYEHHEGRMTLSTKFSQFEETLLHEMGHALDHHTKVGGLPPSASVFRTMRADASQLTPKESKRAEYWLKDRSENFAEVYSLAFSRPGTPAKFFGGLTRDRASKVFANSIKSVREMKV